MVSGNRWARWISAYDAREKCWAAEFRSDRVHSVWCLVVDGTDLRTGAGRLLPARR